MTAYLWIGLNREVGNEAMRAMMFGAALLIGCSSVCTAQTDVFRIDPPIPAHAAGPLYGETPWACDWSAARSIAMSAGPSGGVSPWDAQFAGKCVHLTPGEPVAITASERETWARMLQIKRADGASYWAFDVAIKPVIR